MGNHRHSLGGDTAGDSGMMGRFRPSRLRSVAIVAAKGDFDALIEVQVVGLY
jgi:hypothetical protein